MRVAWGRYEEAGETYAFLMVNKFHKYYQRLRASGYHTMKDLISAPINPTPTTH